MRAVLICSGESATNNKHGNAIDESEFVIRVNKFVTTGYEEYVGTKTSICCAKWHKMPPEAKIADEVWFPHPKPPTMWHALGGTNEITIDDHNINLKSRGFSEDHVLKFLHQSDQTLLDSNFKKGVPSVGIIAIQMALREIGPPIHVIGFDFMLSGWYWDPTHDCTVNFRNCISEELLYYKMLQKSKQIIDISNEANNMER